jgi:hypothetical protein
MLALDVLSGVPAYKYGSGQDLNDYYEAFGSELDLSAIAILRFFEKGAAVAVALHVDQALWQPDELSTTFAPLFDASIDSGEAPPLPNLVRLTREQTFQRLAAALGQLVNNEDPVGELAMRGNAGPQTLNHLDALRLLDKDARREEVAAGHEELFAEMGAMLLVNFDRLAWSVSRELQGAERMEILTHVDSADAVVLIYFMPRIRSICALTYISAYKSGAIHNHILSDVHGMLEARALSSSTPLPLPENSPFVRMNKQQTLFQLPETFDALENQEGCVHLLLSKEFEGALEAPSTAAANGTVLAVYRHSTWGNPAQIQDGDILAVNCRACSARLGIEFQLPEGVNARACPVCEGRAFHVFELGGELLTLAVELGARLKLTPFKVGQCPTCEAEGIAQDPNAPAYITAQHEIFVTPVKAHRHH